MLHQRKVKKKKTKKKVSLQKKKTVYVDDTFSLTLKNGKKYEHYEWESSDDSIIVFKKAKHNKVTIKAISSGKVKIRCHYKKKTYTCKVTVEINNPEE